jgi:hydroxymethylbilane synthase
MDPLTIGTRGSELALFQARAVSELMERHAGTRCRIEIIKTSGDRMAEAPLSDVGGKRLFVKEIEDALLNGAIDLAVHSSKDMPAVLPDGLEVGAVLPREDARDAIVLPAGDRDRAADGGRHGVDDIVRLLGTAPRVGTSSVRRTAQLTRLAPRARFMPIRGNLDTRLRKLDAGEYDALVLAAAGLNRLERAARISAMLPPDVCVPAPGQGIIAVEIRVGDSSVRDVVAHINDPVAAAALAAERAVVVRLGGGCQMPIGAYAAIGGGSLAVTAIVVSVDGARAVRADAQGRTEDAEKIGAQAAELLLARGAAGILADVERARVTVEGLQP